MHKSIVCIKYKNLLRIELSSSATNALTNRLFNELHEILDDTAKDDEISVVILASSSDKIFSFGFNLPEIIKFNSNELEEFYSNFNNLCLKLLSLNKPTIAEINGYAIAGGCILALCCDYRYSSEGEFLIGVNEVKLNLPVPWIALNVLINTIGGRNAEKLCLEGKFLTPEESLKIGLVDLVVSKKKLKSEVFNMAVKIAANYNDAFISMKNSFRSNLISSIEKDQKHFDSVFLEHWFHKETKSKLAEASLKF